MNMESVRIFLDVQRSGSMTAAAQDHYMTQPALGKRVAQLERELGVALFLRGKGHAQVELTEAGRAFLDIAERMLMLYDQAQELKEDAERQYLTIACIRSAHDALMPEVIAQLKQAHPQLCVTIEDHHTAEILALLEKRRVDMGITQSAAASPNLTSELLYEEPYFVVLRPENPLGQKDTIHPQALWGERGIFQAFDQPFEDWFVRWWKPYSVKMRVNTTPTAEHYFSAPEDWMVVPEAVARGMERRGFLARPLLEGPPVHRVFITRHVRSRRKELAWFDEAVKQCSRGGDEKK